MVELVVAADEPPGADVQVVSERFGLPGSMTLDADTVRTVLGMLAGPEDRQTTRGCTMSTSKRTRLV